MPSILNRYIFRETLMTWVAVTVILLLVLMTEQFAQVLGDAAGAKLPKEAIFALMGFGSVQYLTILMPISIFISIMLSLARFYRDSEMAAIMACGIGPASLYRPLSVIALVLAAMAGWLSLDIAPAARRAIEEISFEASKNLSLSMLEAGRFIPLGARNAVLYAETVDANGRLTNVFVQNLEGNDVQVIVAAEAVQRNDPVTGAKVLTFIDGRRYEGVPGSAEFRIIKFAEHGIPYISPEARPLQFDVDAMTLSDLVEQRPDRAKAELQWRLSVPMTLFVLTVLAVPLSKSRPRQGRYSNVAAGIFIYIVYANLLAAGKVWVEQGVTPDWLGLWWVHLLFLAIAIGMLLNQHGGLTRYRAYLRRRFAKATN
jgi:lipopolysaccharide export system permease protein